jgi:ribonuclease P protein subunit POP4
MPKNKIAPLKAGRKQPDAARAEFIGREVRVVNSSCKDLLGLSGVVLDETKNTIIIRTAKGNKTVPKKSCEFEFDKITIQGKRVCHAPEDRLKKVK